jgi:UDP-N-acetylglucosamine--N-acetylmuramyl-(pentapeptide) pyrophosphoryl-undecaprenol N-acetylglucosamine transferase
MNDLLMIAGGGTGGHLFSGLAVAEEWQKRGGQVVFVGTPRGIEVRLVPQYGYPLELINVNPLKGRGLMLKLKTFLGLPVALVRATRLIMRHRPKVVIGIGGYASGPILLMASLMGKPTAVVDQNAMPGMTNRFLGRRATRVFVSFERAERFFDPAKTKLTGNPVIAKRVPTDIPTKPSHPVILVCGGSQGARAINQNFVAAAPIVKKRFPDAEFIVQTGKTDYETIVKDLKTMGIEAQVAPFFDGMDELYARVHVVVSRSGAGTVTELALWGLPAIMVPYPFAADDHQYWNAEGFERHGAAKVIRQEHLTAEGLAAEIESILSDKDRWQKMSDASKALGHPDAAKKVVDELECIAN